MNYFLWLGLVGFSAMVGVNLVALAMGREEARFFSEGWWTPWFANYIVWVTFLIIGVGQAIAGKGNRPSDRQ
jgi:cbb3-type cytochrome oxidase subunit 1